MVKTVGQIQIEQGEDWTKTFKFRTDGGFTAVDLSEATEITFAFEKTDSTWLLLTSPAVAVSGSGLRGDVTVTLTQAQTATLKKGKNQNIECSYLDADDKKQTIILERVLEVVEPEGIVYSS